MPKVNLLNKIRKQKIKKRKASKDSVWFIVKEVYDREYYVVKADKEGFTVVWTNNTDKAMKFHTEKGCQHFVQAYLGSRQDIHLKWMENKIK